MLENKRIILYGGGGFLGTELVSKLYGGNEIIVYSRDESKKVELLSKFPKVKYVLGDVYNQQKVIEESSSLFGTIDISINLAALKVIDSCQIEPDEAINTIVHGAINTKLAAKKNIIRNACLISSDKACAPSGNVYGPCKSIAESIYVNNNDPKSYTNFSVCRYGNVIRSKNSLLDLLPKFIKDGRQIKLLHEEMTRFTITANEAIELIFQSLGRRDTIVIPKLKSYKVKDLFDIYKEEFGLKYTIGEPRVGEKLHELLYSYEESRSIKDQGSFLTLEPNKSINDPKFINTEFSSKDHVMSYEELDNYLSQFNYFMN